MKNPTDNFFNDINFNSIIETIKNIYSSDGSMATLIDWERCLDEADVYAYQNWDLGELVQGPMVKKYRVACVLMWPFKLMPDPRGAKRLLKLGCRIKVKLTHIKVPVHVVDYEDFVPGTRYPRMIKKKVWLFYIEIPRELMDDVKEGSIELAGQNIDLSELSDSYAQDLDKEGAEEQNEQSPDQSLGGMPPPSLGMPPGPGGLPPPPGVI